MCERAVENEAEAPEFVSDHLKAQGMCERAVENEPDALEFVPDHFKTQEMCERIIEKGPWELNFIPNHLKMKEMCVRAAEKYPQIVEFVPDWLVMQGQVKIWHNHNYYSKDDDLIKWHDGYQKRKVQKAQIKEELIFIAWHPSRWWDWCMSEDEKRETEKLWA